MKFLICLVLLTVSQFSVACSCVPHDEFKKHDYIYVGELKQMTPTDGDAYDGLLEIEKIVRGKPRTVEVILFPMTGTSCEVEILVGERYVIFGMNEEIPILSDCSRSTSARNLGI